MVRMADIRSLTDFQRNTRKHLVRLKQTGRPEVLTVNGQAELIVQSADSYQKMLDDVDLIQTLYGIRRGLEQSKRGEVRPMRQFLKGLAKRHGIELEK
jgi:PHD/YefM family antitoxin component YafN of YafNO toxin-antitoxin module